MKAKKLIYGRELEGYPFNAKALLTRGIIVTQRKVFGKHQGNAYSKLPIMYSGEASSEQIRRLLASPEPCMISRFGAYELEAALRYLDIHSEGCAMTKWRKLLCGKMGPFWWDNSIRGGLCWNAGYFPATDADMNAFGKRFLEDCREVDILGSSVNGEERLRERFYPNVIVIPLECISPVWSEMPWSCLLEKKRVLVVHPFAKTIENQYAKRKRLFRNEKMLPDFELKTYRPVVSLAGEKTEFATWIEALDRMCSEIRGIDFDVALIGAGAYGMNIAADIKRSGRKAVHIGGATQLLFGIRGGRWDVRARYVNELYNPHWVSPLPEEVPKNAHTVEKGAYW